MRYFGKERPNRALNTKHGHRATQYHGITQHTRHTLAPVEKRTAKTYGAKMHRTNTQCSLDIVLLGHKSMMVVTLHLASTTVFHVSMRRSHESTLSVQFPEQGWGGGGGQIKVSEVNVYVGITLAFQQYFVSHAAEPQHKLCELRNKAPLGATINWASGQDGAFRPRLVYSS